MVSVFVAILTLLSWFRLFRLPSVLGVVAAIPGSGPLGVIAAAAAAAAVGGGGGGRLVALSMARVLLLLLLVVVGSTGLGYTILSSMKMNE